MKLLAASCRGISVESLFYSLRIKMRGIKPIRSLDYRSGSVRLNDFENQNHSLTDLKDHHSKKILVKFVF